MSAEVNRVVVRWASEHPLPRLALHVRDSVGGEEVNPKIVQEALGHASLTMTPVIYSHVQTAMRKKPPRLWTVRSRSGLVYGFSVRRPCAGAGP